MQRSDLQYRGGKQDPAVKRAVDLTSRQRRASSVAVGSLLEWYGKNARDLPWRRRSDPYAIWVSEIMLQQTQVKTAEPYWNRWMQELPSLEALAEAELCRVLKLWEGLGYYTRARNLHKAAQIIVRQLDGSFPRKYDEVLKLPGIGRYTAGAICSIAFNQATAIVDGNITRVLARFFGIRGDPHNTKVESLLWAIAQSLVEIAARLKNSPKTCSGLNQGLMELGALVCTRHQPNCPVCPLRGGCVAHRMGLVSVLPTRSRRAAPSRRRFVAFIVQKGGRFLIRQRPERVINGGLWEFPNVEVTAPALDAETLARHLLGIKITGVKAIYTLHHSITRYRMRLDVARVEDWERTSRQPVKGRWATRAELGKLAFSSAHRKIANRLEETRRGKK